MLIVNHWSFTVSGFIDWLITDHSRQARTRQLHGHQLKTTWAVWVQIYTSLLFLLMITFIF